MKYLKSFNESTTWQSTGKFISKQYEFKDVVQACEFCKISMDIFEKENHHPDKFSLEKNNLTIHISSHDADAVTEKDYQVAELLDTAYNNLSN
jgi:pterin-4a-carbinolamine dehydratase